MASISRKFEKGVAFSQRVRRIHVEEAATVGAKLLDGDLGGRRPHGDHLLFGRYGLGQGVAGGVR
jgi:hypothetical protein